MSRNAIKIIDPKRLSKECKITFILGNGFDLGLGLKTKYSDVYDGYIQDPPSSEIVSRFKKDLEDSSANNYENWSDFEMGMACYAKQLSSEDEFVACIRDFKSYMVKHLQNENQRIIDLLRNMTNTVPITEELNRSLEKFHEGLTPNVIALLNTMMQDADIVRNYITFNYTTTLEAFLANKMRSHLVQEATPIHIHGRLDRDVVLGVDNTSQLEEISFTVTRKGKRAFVKTFFNEQYDRKRVESAKKIIAESSIICVYGFSLGESDQTWVEALANWILEDSNHHLVIYDYDEKLYNTYNYDEIMEVEDTKKSKILNKLRIGDETAWNQIHIPVGRGLFNFSFVKVESPYRTLGSMKNYY